MPWHTPETKTCTLPPSWEYFTLIVTPMFLILDYKLAPFYIMDACLAKKPKHPV
jgi:hypothetical protein